VRIVNILWNLLGLGVPLLIAVVTVPPLIDRIGADRFGLLALAWGLVGYAGALDLGVGRATTQRIAGLIGRGEQRAIPDVLASASRITAISGLLGMAILCAGALGGAYRMISAESVPQSEIYLSMILLGIALPLQSMSATYRGVNEAYQNFRAISILRMVLGAGNFGAPFLVALFTIEMHWLIGTLTVSRLLAFLVYRQLASRCLSDAVGSCRGRFRSAHARGLLEFGGWFTVSGLVSPVLAQADRYLIGILISTVAVTEYVLPYEVTVQSTIIVGAVTSVAFPAITMLLGRDAPAAAELFKRWLARVAAGMLALTLVLAAIMPLLLEAWVGDHVAEDSVRVGQILCVGVFLNSIGAMYFSWLHAHGRARLTAIFHLVELPLFLGLLYALIESVGIVGAAIAWVARVALDTALLALASRSVGMGATRAS